MSALRWGLLWSLIACANIACANAEARNAARPDPARAVSPPAAFGPWIAFYASFDAQAAADLAHGSAAPRTVHGALGFSEGRAGKALRVGVAGQGVQIDYALVDNVDFARPGGLSLWVSPRGWLDQTPAGNPYVRFVRATGRDRSVFLFQREGRSGAREKLAAGFFDLPGGEKYFLQIEAETLWRREEWHLIAATWDSTGFAISIDGAPFIRKAVPGDRIRDSFGGRDPAGALLLGDESREFSLVDDLAVYSRALRDEDVALLSGRRRAAADPR